MGNNSVTVLVVDDEEVIRTMVGQMLQAAGYDVQLAQDGPSAITLCESQDELIDIALIDHELPGMTGSKLMESLWARHPKLKMLLMSGYPESVTQQDSGAVENRHHFGFLPKPFTIPNLMDAIKRELTYNESGERKFPMERLACHARAGASRNWVA